MVSKSCALVFLTFCCFARQAEAQDACVPETVINMTLNQDHSLSWAVREDEPCEITEFMLHIFQPGSSHEYIFSVKETWTDISFLDVCEEWTFVIEAISGFTKGRDRRMVAYLQLLPDADLAIGYMNSTHIEETGDVHLHWGLRTSGYEKCPLQYRVTVETNYIPVIEDIYVNDRFINLHFLSPCTNYLFTVRAINVGHPTVEGPIRYGFHQMPPMSQSPPTLVAAYPGANSVNTTWRLNSIWRNPCRVTQFTVETTSATWFTLIEDSWERPDVNITLESLLADNLYVLKAYTYNVAGVSGAATVAVQTLKEEEDDK